MRQWIRLQGFLLACMILSGSAFAQAPQPGYDNPAPALPGTVVQDQDLAVIETNCADIDQAIDLRDALVENGAVVSIITSPQRMLAWVPEGAREAVRSTQLSTATGSIGVMTLSYSSAEFDMNHDPNQMLAAENDADRAIVEYLDFIKRPLTDEEKEAIREREFEIQKKMELEPPLDCMDWPTTDMQSPRELNGGIPAIGGTEDAVLRRTAIRGFVVHTSFFVESKSGTGTWNWSSLIYTRYRNFYIAGMNYWSSFVARYGKSVTTLWRLYSPYSSGAQVNGEPTSIGEDSYIPQCVIKVAPPTPWDLPPNWEWAGAGLRWGWYYNKRIREAYDADDAICGFICYKPTYDEAVWPHANGVIWGGTDFEGVYFTLDTQYWQAELDPFSAPQRNVIAHEIGHLWGAPDEYRSDNCNWSYRGIRNVNCQSTTSAYLRSGTMKGWDGIMVTNYTNGNSLATPVHTGVINKLQAVTTRCFSSTPTGVTLSFRNCDGIGTVNRNTPTCIPMDYDYCHRIVAPSKVFKSGQWWYFDHWKVTRENNSVTNIDYYGNELPSYAFSSTFANAAKDVEAVFTNNPPDIFSNNTTLQADLAPGNFAVSPALAIGLRWRVKYNMLDADTHIEYEASAGNWKELSFGDFTLGPFRVDINQWTGVHINKVPNASGSGSTVIQPNKTYRFRIVGEFNGNRGTPSTPASVTTRPASPADTAYCYDANEPNSPSNPTVLTSSGPGMETYALDGAIAISPYPAEFTWFVPIWDFYRITVINVSNQLFGERVTLKVRPKDGSDFVPRLRAQRVGQNTYINGTTLGGVATLNLTSDGEYLIRVESQISQTISWDFVDRSGGHYSFGEYELEVSRTVAKPGFKVPDLCINCIKLKLVQPLPGEIIMRPHPKFDLFSTGMDRNTPQMFQMYYQTPPGYSFLGFTGDLGEIQKNPADVSFGPNSEPGEYSVYPVIEAISSGQAELVVINPEGPGGPFDARQATNIGGTLTAEAKPPQGYTFVGWGGDTTSTTNPLQVTMWRSKRLIAYYRPKPCTPEPMTEWRHILKFTNARQNEVEMTYGMLTGAGDGLEAGQVDLPPIPPPTAFDIRFINIAGSQGSTTDQRAVKSSHTYQGRVQTGGTAPVEMRWDPPAASPNASYTLKIQGVSGSIDMRSESSFTFKDEGSYIFTIEVKESSCPEPTEENEVIVTTEDVNNDEWPCISLKLRVVDRQTGEPRPYYNPYNLKLFQKSQTGENVPTRIREFIQRDSVLIVRICPDPDEPTRDREIVVVNENENDEQKKDTVTVRVPPPVPDGDGDPERFVLRHEGEWELVSTPLALKSPDVATLFQDPNLRLYGFDTEQGAYIAAENMVFGEGYWMKGMPFDQILIGLSKPSLMLEGLSGIGEPYGYGWNLIGSLASAVDVSSIQQNPAGSMKSIFGWDPSQGYIVPTQVEPGKGYWVRLDPDAKLTLSTSGVRGSGGGTAYARTVSAIDLAGILTLQNGEGQTRPLYISGTVADDAMRKDLTLPEVPPAGAFDLRTAQGSQFLFPGENIVTIRGSGRHVLSLPSAAQRATIEVRDENDRLLHTFDGSAGDHMLIDVTGERMLKLRTRVAPASEQLTLGSNYPNPFRSSTRTFIPYSLTQDGTVRLTVYDMLGREVRTLVLETQTAGSHVATWDGLDANGLLVPVGMYTCRLESAAGVVSRTLSIVK
ncbi:T9SS type A sorting domain-containing protein [bacterium]|nr:T9SS type A sorting domain-containing protein [bacterium]